MNDITFIVSYVLDSDLVYHSKDGKTKIRSYEIETKDATNYIIHYIARETGKVFEYSLYLEAQKIINSLRQVSNKYFEVKGVSQTPVIHWPDENGKYRESDDSGKWYALDEKIFGDEL